MRAAVTGTFAAVTKPPAVSLTISPVYSATDAILNFGPPDDINHWIGLSGLWTVASNWSLGLPTAAQDVQIDVAGAQTITIPSGSNLSVHSLLLNDELLIDGAILNVGTSLIVENGGTLTLAGGQVAGIVNNRPGGTVQVTGLSRVTNVLQTGLLRVLGSDTVGIGQLSIGAPVDNAGEIVLDTSAGGNGAVLIVGGGTAQLINTGSIRSIGRGALGSNAVHAAVSNQGTIEAQRGLFVANPGLFDTSVGTLDVQAGQVLTVDSGTVRIGGSTGLGSGTGVLDVTGNATLDLVSGMTVGAATGVRLGLSGFVNVTAATPTTLTNVGTLALSNDTLGANITLVNQGTLSLSNVNGAGTLDNRAGASAELTRNNTLDGLVQAGLLRVRGDDALGAGQLSVASSVTNTGTIELESFGDWADRVAGARGHQYADQSGRWGNPLDQSRYWCCRERSHGRSRQPGHTRRAALARARWRAVVSQCRNDQRRLWGNAHAARRLCEFRRGRHHRQRDHRSVRGSL